MSGPPVLPHGPENPGVPVEQGIPLIRPADGGAPDAGIVLTPDGGLILELDGGAPAAVQGTRHTDWLVIPLVTYNSDTKLGYGAAGQIQGAGGVDPYRYLLAAQLYFTTGGVQSHWIHYDSPRFQGSKLRVWGRLEYHRDKFAPYYGIGNDTSDNPASYAGLSGSNPFTYDRIGPFLRAGAAYPFIPQLYAFGFVSYTDVTIHPYAGSLVELQQPYGINGGHELQLNVGLYYDTRDHEAVPTRGGLIELSGRGVSQALASSFTYGGLDLRMLYFKSFHRRLVLAMRAQGDALTKGAPFFELPNFGGVESYDGIGGLWSERGVPQDRYVARLKFIGTLELRTLLAEFMVRGEPLNFGLNGFLDLGRVYQPGQPDGPFVHPGYGAGARLWRRSFVLRVDLASSPDRAFNIYLVFGNFF
ncbi:MAG: BamA/TamA family outer membrane protein [Deltaproteobacteria bacterium]|nr:BamA/TamA family outer membrane protein [Deltaproteobacteria bacterium]